MTAGKFIFDSNIYFALKIYRKALDDFCTDQDKPKESNAYIGVRKFITSFTTDKISAFLGKKCIEIIM